MSIRIKLFLVMTVFSLLLNATACDSCSHSATSDPIMPSTISTTTTATVSVAKPTTTTTLTEAIEETSISTAELGLVGKQVVAYGDIDTAVVTKLNSLLGSYSKNISIACWSTDGSKAILYNTKQPFFSACTIKMPVMYSYCKQIDAGLIDRTDTLTYQSKHYYKGSGDIRYSKFGTTYSVDQLVKKSLSISDNVAYIMLLDAYGKKPLGDLSESLDTPSVNFSCGSKWAKNINARDLLVVWSDIYTYFSSGSDTANMLKDACTNTPYNYGTKTITEYEYSHKSGNNYGDFRAYNDAGIVWSSVPYVYVVLTQSEGTKYDSDVINSVMQLVNKVMTDAK